MDRSTNIRNLMNFQLFSNSAMDFIVRLRQAAMPVGFFLLRGLRFFAITGLF
jgi:hypothetical protein